MHILKYIGIDNEAPSGPLQPEESARLISRAANAAVAVAACLILLKGGAWFATGSLAMLASLVDSSLDGAASLINLFAIRYALLPRDETHRFGHGKAEALAGLAQAVFISASAFLIVWESVARLINPSPIESSLAGIAVLVISILMTVGLVTYQTRVVRLTRAVAIAADSLHYRGDIFMNAGAILALVLSANFGIVRADPAIALIIAAVIAGGAVQIVRGASAHLMDRELPESDRQRLAEITLAHPKALEMHDLRTRQAGTGIFIQLHLEMESNISLMEAHHIADEVEAQIKEAFPGADVIIHQDPAGLEELAELDKV